MMTRSSRARCCAVCAGLLLTFLRLLVFAGVGIVSGFAAGLFSIGGGIIRIPVFVHLLPLFGVPHPIVMHASVATSLALVVPSSLMIGTVSTVGAIISGWQRPPSSLGYVDLVIWAAMVPTVMIAAPLGVHWGHRLSRAWLSRLLTALLLATAIEMAIKVFHER